MQLTKVSVYENKFVDSYEVNIFGIVSNFSTDAQRLFLTELDNLSIYNHTSSLANVSASWQNNLFSGSIVYALTDSGTNVYYSLTQENLGIDDPSGSLNVQNFKPAIKVKLVWDAIFAKLGYTYTGSFFNDPIFNNAYLILNNNLRYPVYPNIELNNLARFKATTITGSFQDIALTPNNYTGFPANSTEYDYNSVLTLGNPLVLTIPKESNLSARLNLVFRVTSTGAGSGAPAFYLKYVNANTGALIAEQSLDNINEFLSKLAASRTQTVTETFELAPSDFQIPTLRANVPIQIFIKQIPQGSSNFTVTLNPQTSRVGTSLEVLSLNQGADYEILEVPFNMPYGTSGITLLSFIRGIQKKFNLVLYEDKTTPNQFKVDTFNDWYKKGEYKNFNQYIDLNQKVEFIPANTLSVNKLDFKDALDTDYITTLFQRENNRGYGEAILIDTGSYFSQGEFKVETTLASGPLNIVPGSVTTGSYLTQVQCTQYEFIYYGERGGGSVRYTACNGSAVTASLGFLAQQVPSFSDCLRTNTPITTTGEVYYYTQGDCSTSIPTVVTGSQFPVYIPYYIASTDRMPARVLPRIMFYNGLLPATPYYIQGYEGPAASDWNNDYNNDFGGNSNFNLAVDEYYSYPYFDNYSVVSGSSLPSSGSYSLLFNNETPSLGSTPTNSLIDSYWATYLELLYNPRTRLVNAAAVIPLADYFNMELNDVIQFRSNYYHLRAINDYNLTTGECTVQLLGPVIRDAVSNVVFGTPTP